MIYKPANIFRRIGAIVIDTILMLIIMIIIYQYFLDKNIDVITLDGYTYIYFLAIYFFYFFIFESIFQKTVGKKIFNLEILRSDNKKPGVLDIFIRNLLRPLDMIGFYLLGFIFIVFTNKNQRFGDLIANTYVIRSIE